MKTRIATTIIFSVGFILLAIASLGTVSARNYVTGAYAKYCYLNGSENTNIKEKIFFSTLAECGKPLHE